MTSKERGDLNRMTNAKALKDISDGRTSQLRTLLDAVAATRAGNARLCLVTGDSGSGKTTLLEILKRTVSGDENMMPTLASGSPKTVWAVETCRPDREFGPFWNILNSVSTQAAQSTAHGSDLLRSALGRVFTVLRFIFDVGPDGVAVADPITGLITKAAAYPIKIFLNDIENWSGLSHVPNIEDSSQIYELVWRALKFASESAPLVVVLDDLQEADEGSQALFFSLANQLNFHRNQRICLVGVYRRDHAGKRGLDGRLLRFRSKAMNPQAIGINLDETVGGDAGEAFVRGLFKSIPNGLTREFVNELFRRTQGHAQFTTDLLRFFLEKNILGFDANRKLVQLSEIDFRKLPDSVESLIAERLKLLDKSLRELVDIASVQGVEFGAEVILQINKIS